MSRARVRTLVGLVVWDFRWGRLAFHSRLRDGRRVRTIQHGCLYEIWTPLGLGFYWRQRKYLRYIQKGA